MDVDVPVAAKAGLTACAALLMTAVGIIAPLTKNAEGEYSYVVPSAVLLSEVFKLLIAVALVLHAQRRQGGIRPLAALREFAMDRESRWEFLLYAVPSAIYFVLNNLQLVICLLYTSPSPRDS